ncbi:hypothetical protein SDC9_161400 [bioreactor metagenome]|uniref:STAS domain-containing protein n=1 Tax=bioreactor metagenome TaxID=1076179 RepID=A0A645FPB1_9ZZZZ
MNFNIENRDNSVIVTIAGEKIEGTIATELKTQILIVAQPDINALIFNFSNIKIIDSSGLGALLLAYRQLKEYDIPVILVGVNEFVKNLLNITRIENIFHYYPNVENALTGIEHNQKK